jgi:hypothetical protein
MLFTTFNLEVDCDQTAIGLPPVTSAVFVEAVILVKCGRLGETSECKPMMLILKG